MTADAICQKEDRTGLVIGCQQTPSCLDTGEWTWTELVLGIAGSLSRPQFSQRQLHSDQKNILTSHSPREA